MDWFVPQDEVSLKLPGSEGPIATWRKSIPKYLLWALASVATAGLVLFVLWGGPSHFTQQSQNGLTAEQELKAKNDVRTTLVQTVAGLAVAAGAVVTYHTFRQNQLDQVNRHDREERTYKLNESQQVTDTYIEVFSPGIRAR